MSLLEQILNLIGEYLDKTDKRTTSYQTLLKLRADIMKLVDNTGDKITTRETTYHCSICRKISVRLRDNKYCLDCFDKFID